MECLFFVKLVYLLSYVVQLIYRHLDGLLSSHLLLLVLVLGAQVGLLGLELLPLLFGCRGQTCFKLVQLGLQVQVVVEPEVGTLHVEVHRLAHRDLQVVALVENNLLVRVRRSQLRHGRLLQQNVVLDQLNVNLLDASNL